MAAALLATVPVAAASLAVALLAAATAALLPAAASAAASSQTSATRAGPASLDDLQAAAAKARTQIHRLEGQMKAVSDRYHAARAQLDVVNGDLSQTRLQLAHSQTDLDSQRELVAQRLAGMYKMGDYTWVDVFAGSGGLSDVENRLTFFRLLGEDDQQTADDLARLAGQVSGLEQAQEGQRQDALALEAEIATQRAVMTDAIAQRQALLNDLVHKIRKIVARHGALLARVPATRGAYTPLTWARTLLVRLGMPVTTDNVAAIAAWEMAEGGHWHNTARYNPLNTTQLEPGATAMNSVGVKAYVSWAQGFTATVATFHHGFYGAILAALRKGNDAVAVARAVGASPWGTGDFEHLL